MSDEETLNSISRAKILRLYKYFAPIYSPLRPFWARTIIPQAERYLERIVLPETLSAEASVLDLGCGPGINLALLLRLKLPFAQYIGIDLSPTMLKWRRHHDATNQGFVVADSMRLPFDACTFDVVLSTWMFSHLEQPSRVIQEALRLLRPDGWLVVACFTRGLDWRTALLQKFEALFLTSSVPRGDILTWPGLVEFKTFAGGGNAVIRLRKEM
jgi:SAM-dependent methyltransferase